jgi:hypothetical protein
MFGKKKVVKEVAAVPVPEPQVAEDFSEAQAEEVKQEETEAPVEEELTSEQVKLVLENMASDIAKIKYHLRLDF